MTDDIKMYLKKKEVAHVWLGKLGKFVQHIVYCFILLTEVVPFSVVFRVYDSDGNEYLDSQVLTGTW